MKKIFENVALIAAVVLIVAFINACAHGSKEVAPNIDAIKAEQAELQRYYPLAVGNEWTYEGVFVGKRDKRTIKIERKEDGFFVDNLGAKLVFDANGLRDERRYLLKLPLHITNKWVSIPAPVTAEHYSITRTGFNDTVPAGTFEDCVEVVSSIVTPDGDEMSNTITYAKDVGIIRIFTKMKHQGKEIPQVKVELVSYKVTGEADALEKGPANE